MSSTSDDLSRFFASRLAPLKAEIAGFVPTAFDAACESYLQDVFESESIVSQDDMITSLVDMWRTEGLASLVALESELRRIAARLRARGDQPHGTVSSFTYAMY